jgi:ketosteroid isomerase-like protein
MRAQEPDRPEVPSAETTTDDLASVRAWMAAWGAEVAAVDLAAGRQRFSPAVTAFGTHAHVVHGLDVLVAEQWSQIWPAIEDFRFLVDELHVEVSPDRLLAVAIVPWSSTGIGEEGTRFDRPGRATTVLRRSAVDAPWVGVHTHFSLGRDVPARTYGSRPPRS